MLYNSSQDGVERSGHAFKILGEACSLGTFGARSGIREIARLRRIHGLGRWRKRIARVR